MTPQDRLSYIGDLRPVISRVCSSYTLGELVDYSLIEIGYEDCNVTITTAQGKFVAKIFAKKRTSEEIGRYSDIMERVVAAGVQHPRLHATNGKTVYHDSETGLSLVLMDFIEGETFLSLNRAPTVEERRLIIEQAAKVNAVDLQPAPLFDSWAIPNIKVMVDKVRSFIEPGDMNLVEEVVRRFDSIPLDSLPHGFVHGDFTKANIMKGVDGRMYILDFSVANWYPRIQELAVIVANLLHDSEQGPSLQKRCDLVANEYSEIVKLTPEERKHLFDYSLAGVAMEFLGSHQEKYINGNDTDETNYWLRLGREGLRSAL
jgi:Ser/Thr protein kinase RdoA (MazF antagonist)